MINNNNQVDCSVEDRLIYFRGWFIRMRWIACVVAGFLIVIAVKVLNYLEEDAFVPLMALLVCLIMTNILYTIFLRRGWLIRCLAEIGIYSDLVILTTMLHFSGGIENPLSFVYLFHIIIGGILLSRRKCYVIVLMATCFIGLLAISEMTELLRHYTLLIFPHPMVGEDKHLLHTAHRPEFVVSLLTLQFTLMYFTGYFTTTIMNRLRTEEKKSNTERQRLERVFQAAGAGFTILDKKLRPVWLNDQIQVWLNLSQEIVGKSAAYLEKWTGGRNGPAAKTFKDGKVRVVERERIDEAGNHRFYQVTIAPLLDHQAQVFQVVELTQDITRRKIMDVEMIHSEKMAALGFLSAGIAHEVGNPLASMSTRLRLLEDNPDVEFLNESLRLLQSQIGRISRIVHGISQFARPKKNIWTACQINALILEMLSVLQLHHLSKNCRIQTELANDLPKTMAVKDQLGQVFLNLGLNALEAMLQGGTLTIETFREDEEILIRFADTGEGMNEEARTKLFTPFYSTKKKGLGLGLGIVHNMVNAHGGRLEVESELGKGSEITVILPIRLPQQKPEMI